jgi:hypothetical protein
VRITANVSLSQNLHLFIFRQYVDLNYKKQLSVKKWFVIAAKKQEL